MEESVTSEGLEFKWGKKKCVGGKKKDVQFYESFIYDGDEYRLYDSVLVGDASEPDSTEPFIGMIIKIWEHANKHIPRKVKLLWFFKPSEIAPYLEGVPDVLANELFLASGEGLGLANINQLVTNYSSAYYVEFSFSLLLVEHVLAFFIDMYLILCCVLNYIVHPLLFC